MNRNKVTLVLVSILIIALAYWFLQGVTNKVGEDINNFYWPKQKKYYPLSGIDFSEGEYALYVRHKTHGTFWVDNQAALKDNKNKLKIKRSLANYLPGEGDRSFGIALFKNGELVKEKFGGLFDIFEIGDLQAHGKTVEKKHFNGVRREIISTLDSLEKEPPVYIYSKPNFSENDREFHFRIHFPSIAVPVTRGKDKYGYERILTVNGIDKADWDRGKDGGFHQRWERYFSDCIRRKAGNITDYDLSVSYGTLSNAYLFETNSDWGQLENNEGGLLYVNDLMFYHFEAYIGANKTNAKKLHALDYSDCLTEAQRNKPQVVAKMEQLIEESKKPSLSLARGEVGLLGYIDQVKMSKALYEQEYSVSWFEVLEK